jgi:hypothetical protein
MRTLIVILMICVSGGTSYFVWTEYNAVVASLQESVSDHITPALQKSVAQEEAQASEDANTNRIFDSRTGNELTPSKVASLFATKPVKGGAELIFSERLDLTMLMSPGEELPKGDLGVLAAEIRSTKIAQARCTFLTNTIASECAYVDHRVMGRKDSWPNFVLESTLAVTFPSGYGTIPDQPNLSLQRKQIYEKFPIKQANYGFFTPEEYEAATVEALEFIEEACEILRAASGNCFVRSASIKPRRTFRDSDNTAFTGTVNLELNLAYLIEIEMAGLR